ncbi:MAG: hypothetical protein FRX48_03757 [Lasallia pustulata]|uniref:Uncharacterized protein n=1 Tax=Lasallia pustulata TaxID=136370 RepID=A0A5M8PUV6_9LECA|nr:MAG: hypothetical protein FRX48_03757 [Lasallia pustulata]
MPKDLNTVDGIVKYYAAIARSNTVVLSPMIAPEDRHAMDSLLQESRKAFQRLFKCASFAVSSKFQKEGFLPLSKVPSPFNGNESQASDIRDTDAEDSADTSGSEAEYDAMAAQITAVTGKGSKKATFFCAFLTRPVVHVALHLEDVAAEYATPSNCITFTGEDKHRSFKGRVLHTNHCNIQFLHLHDLCPNVFNGILPHSEQMELKEDSDLAIEEDAQHWRPVFAAPTINSNPNTNTHAISTINPAINFLTNFLVNAIISTSIMSGFTAVNVTPGLSDFTAVAAGNSGDPPPTKKPIGLRAQCNEEGSESESVGDFVVVCWLFGSLAHSAALRLVGGVFAHGTPHY